MESSVNYLTMKKPNAYMRNNMVCIEHIQLKKR